MENPELDLLRTKAKSLSEADRAELAHDLLASLDGEPDADAAAAWETEVARRLAEVEQGAVQTISLAELSDRLSRRMR